MAGKKNRVKASARFFWLALPFLLEKPHRTPGRKPTNHFGLFLILAGTTDDLYGNLSHSEISFKVIASCVYPSAFSSTMAHESGRLSSTPPNSKSCVSVAV
jgi:hypothetical protein